MLLMPRYFSNVLSFREKRRLIGEEALAAVRSFELILMPLNFHEAKR